VADLNPGGSNAPSDMARRSLALYLARLPDAVGLVPCEIWKTRWSGARRVSPLTP
jgi:hypothetical protein